MELSFISMISVISDLNIKYIYNKKNFYYNFKILIKGLSNVYINIFLLFIFF